MKQLLINFRKTFRKSPSCITVVQVQKQIKHLMMKQSIFVLIAETVFYNINLYQTKRSCDSQR